MRASRLDRLVRLFPQNGIKFLLEEPRNVRDLLGLLDSPIMDRIDFTRLSLVRTTFVARDFRHVEADIVLTAPLRRSDGGRLRRLIWLYVLLEHRRSPTRSCGCASWTP